MRNFAPGRIRLFAIIAALAFVFSPEFAFAQDQWPNYDVNEFEYGSGFYFAWWKFALILPVFWVWVSIIDWISRDSELVESTTKMYGALWNPILIAVFLFGFLLVLFVPWFFLSFPLYVISAIAPFFIYTSMRNKHFEGSKRVFSKEWFKKRKAIKKGLDEEEYVDEAKTLAQDVGAEMEFSASGASRSEQQKNLITARQNYGFVPVKEMINDAIWRRADNIRLDYTADAVSLHYQIDGLWLPQPPIDRPTGDAMLESIKHLAALNPADRRGKQGGKFSFKIPDRALVCRVKTQGTKTGEVAQLTLSDKKAAKYSLEDLGMRPDQLQKLKTHLHQPGYPIVAAMPGDGLTSTWIATLEEIDRVTRELVGLVTTKNDEREVENITFHDIGDGSDALATVDQLLLKEPDGFIVPDPISAKVVDRLTAIANDETDPKFVISHVRARSASEALLRMLKYKCDRKAFAKAVTLATCQRLVRRLCMTCRQQYQASPELAKKLGANPKEPLYLFRQYEPTPEELVDDKGNPVEPPVCQTCAGLGYVGRMAVYELLEVNDDIRKILVSKPKLELLDKAARKARHKTIQQEGIHAVIDGHTSLAELQRVLKG